MSNGFLLGQLNSLTGQGDEGNFFFTLAVIVVAVMAIFFLFFGLLMKQYKRCPSNRVLVIFGRSGHESAPAKCVHGGARLVIPLIEDYGWLYLEPMQIEIPLRNALSMENIRVNVPSVFTVAVGTTPELMQNAAIRLLGLSEPEIKKQAEDIIFGQLRQVIASMQIEDINRDREKFLENIQNSLEPELKKIGLVLINVNITDITDESGYIEAIGQKAASQAIQKARGDVADNERMGETRVAEAEREKAISVADANKTREIGIRAAQREQAVRVAELVKEQEIGEKRAAYEREVQVKDAEREMRVQTSQAEARAIEGENTSKADMALSQAQLKVKQAEAYELGETRTRAAQAAVLEAEHHARARAAAAEAERIEAEKRAELEAPARAQKARVVVDAEAEAEKRRIEAEGEARAVFARLEAEARGQYEMLAKKAAGMHEIISACGGSDKAFQLLMLEHLDNLVEASATAISNIKFDKVIVWEGGANGAAGGESSTVRWLQSMARTMPPMMSVLKEVGGIELPETLARFVNTDGAPSDSPAKPADAKSETPS